MSEEAYTFDEAGIRKVVDATRRVQQLPQGRDGVPFQPLPETRDWIYFRYPEFKTQSGGTGDSIAPGYSTALESGSANPGAGYMYWYNFYGDHRNIGFQFVRQDSYGDPWARVKRSGLYRFNLTLYCRYHANPSMSGQTGTTGAASAGTAHTHPISNFYDTSRVRIGFLQIDLQKRVGTTGSSWGNVDYWRLQDILDGNTQFSSTSDSQLVTYTNSVKLLAGWDIRFFSQIVRAYPTASNYNPMVVDRAYSSMFVEYLGPCESAMKSTFTYMESP